MEKEETKRIFAANRNDHPLFGILDVCRIIRSYFVTPFLEFVKSEPAKPNLKVSFHNEKHLVIDWYTSMDHFNHVKLVDLKDLLDKDKKIDVIHGNDYFYDIQVQSISRSPIKVNKDRLYVNRSNIRENFFGYVKIGPKYKSVFDWVYHDSSFLKPEFILIDEKNQLIYVLYVLGYLNVYELDSGSLVSDHSLIHGINDVQLCTKSNQLMVSWRRTIISYEIRVSGGKISFHRNESFRNLDGIVSMCVDDGILITTSRSCIMVLDSARGTKIKKLKNHSNKILSMAMSIKMGLLVTVDFKEIRVYKMEWRVF